MTSGLKQRALGSLQLEMLEHLGNSGGEWYAGCGRHWRSDWHDAKVYQALVQRGYVEEREIKPALPVWTKSLFRMTREGREWYFTHTGKRVQRHPFAKFTEPYEEGEFPVHPTTDESADAAGRVGSEFRDYSVGDDGIQGWTVSELLDNRDRRIIGAQKVWWVCECGFDEAKRLAEDHATWLNDHGSSQTNSGPAIAVPLMIAPFK